MSFPLMSFLQAATSSLLISVNISSRLRASMALPHCALMVCEVSVFFLNGLPHFATSLKLLSLALSRLNMRPKSHFLFGASISPISVCRLLRAALVSPIRASHSARARGLSCKKRIRLIFCCVSPVYLHFTHHAFSLFCTTFSRLS